MLQNTCITRYNCIPVQMFHFESLQKVDSFCKYYKYMYIKGFYFRNEFHFSGVHGAMNRNGSHAK